MCTVIQKNIGIDIFQEIEHSSHVPCSVWSLETQNYMMDPFHSPEQRSKRMKDWLQYIYDKAPMLIKKYPEALQHLQKICADAISPAQAWALSFLVPDIGALDYDTMSISKLNRDTMHQAKRTFRNEWWSLYGRITTRYGEGFIAVHILRHTNMPESLWSNDRIDKDYSDIRIVSSIVLPGSIEILEENSTIYPESWNLLNLLDTPFGIQFGRNFLVPYQTETIFPLKWQWSIAEHQIMLKLDNTKPLFMMNSNGCLICRDGIGIKKYTYPVVSGTGELDGISVQFQGVFEHGWESAVLPEGTSSSIALRSFINIEKSFVDLTRPDDWTYCHVNLNNNFQIACYCMPTPSTVQKAFHPILFTISTPNGTVLTPKLSDISITVQHIDDQGYPKNFIIEQKNKFSIRLAVLSDTSDSVGFSHAGGWVQGQWNNQAVTGFGFIQTTNRLSYEERAQKILELLFQDKEISDFLQWSKETNYFKNAPDSNDLQNSWLLWFIPVIIVSVLVVMIIYLVWARQNVHKKPWVRASTLSKKHRFF